MLTTPYPAAPGGAERFVEEAARALARRTDTTLHYLADADRPVPAGVSALRHRALVPPGAEGPRLAVAPGVAAALRADVVHVHQYGTALAQGLALAGRIMGRPVFVTDHGSSGLAAGRRLGLLRLWDGFLPVSKFAAAETPPERTRVVHGAVDVDRFVPGLRSPDPYALYVGRIFPHKGIDWLIRSLPAGGRLVVAGRPDERAFPGYLGHLRGLAAGRDVTFALDVDDATLLRLYQGASVAVLPSVWRDAYGRERRVPELFGLTLVEAMACATPVICSNVASMPEIVRDGVTGAVVEPGDEEALRFSLDAFLEDPERVERVGAAARRDAVTRFTWERVAAEYLAAYREMAG